MDEKLCLRFIKNTLLKNSGSWSDYDVFPYDIKNLSNDLYTSLTATVSNGLFYDPEVNLQGIGTFRRDYESGVVFEGTDYLKKIFIDKTFERFFDENIRPQDAKELIRTSLERILGNSADKYLIQSAEDFSYDSDWLNNTVNILYAALVESFIEMISSIKKTAIAPDLGHFSVNPPYFSPDVMLQNCASSH